MVGGDGGIETKRWVVVVMVVYKLEMVNSGDGGGIQTWETVGGGGGGGIQT